MARNCFWQATTGDVGNHNYAKPHPEYNKAVKALWDDWSKGKNLMELNEKQAEQFIAKVKNSKDPRIKNFLDDLHAKAKRIKLANKTFNDRLSRIKTRVGVGIVAIGVVGAASAAVACPTDISQNEHYQLAQQYAQAGDQAGVDDEMYDLAADLAIQTGDTKMLPFVYGTWWWLR